MRSEAQIMQTSTNLLDSIRTESSFGLIVFHSQTTKKSLVAKQLTGKKAIDSIFTFIGHLQFKDDCFKSGVYNSFGQISIFKDSSEAFSNNENAIFHFILYGKCSGFYLKSDERQMHFHITEHGKNYLGRLFEENRSSLK